MQAARKKTTRSTTKPKAKTKVKAPFDAKTKSSAEYKNTVKTSKGFLKHAGALNGLVSKLTRSRLGEPSLLGSVDSTLSKMKQAWQSYTKASVKLNSLKPKATKPGATKKKPATKGKKKSTATKAKKAQIVSINRAKAKRSNSRTNKSDQASNKTAEQKS